MSKKDVNSSKTSKKGVSNKNNKSVNNSKEKEVIKVENASLDNAVNVGENVKKNKGDLFLILGLILVVVVSFIVMRDKNAGPSYELPLTLSGEVGLQELTYSEYQEKINNGDHFVVIIERATCSHCVTYLPIAEDFAANNNLPMYYVDTDTFSAEDWNTFESSNTFLKRAKGKWGTPTTIVLAGRESVDYIEGVTDEEKLLKLYQKYFNMGEE